jgi:hypothetical protein
MEDRDIKRNSSATTRLFLGDNRLCRATLYFAIVAGVMSTSGVFLSSRKFVKSRMVTR